MHVGTGSAAGKRRILAGAELAARRHEILECLGLTQGRADDVGVGLGGLLICLLTAGALGRIHPGGTALGGQRAVRAFRLSGKRQPQRQCERAQSQYSHSQNASPHRTSITAPHSRKARYSTRPENGATSATPGRRA